MSVQSPKLDTNIFNHGNVQGQPPLESLPDELFNLVILNLSPSDVTAATGINRNFQAKVISAANANAKEDIARFINELIECLDKLPAPKEMLVDLLKTIQLPNHPDLPSLKSVCLEDYKRRIAEILATLDEAVLDGLWTIQTPIFFEDILQIAKTYAKLELATEIEDTYQRSSYIRDLARLLVQRGDFEGGVRAAVLIPDSLKKRETLKGIYTDLIDKNKLEKALYLAKRFQDNYALTDICMVLSNKGDIEKAIQLVNQEANETNRDIIFRTSIYPALQRLVQIQKIQTAVELANAIEDPQRKNKALEVISETLLKFDDMDNAFEIAMTSQDPNLKDKIMDSIIKKMAQKGRIQDALFLINLVVNETVKDKALSYVSQMENHLQAVKIYNEGA